MVYPLINEDVHAVELYDKGFSDWLKSYRTYECGQNQESAAILAALLSNISLCCWLTIASK